MKRWLHGNRKTASQVHSDTSQGTAGEDAAGADSSRTGAGITYPTRKSTGLDIGEIEAWRAWRRAGDYLTSFNGMIWEPDRPAEAIAPTLNGSTGIYAKKTLRDIQIYTDGDRECVIGRVRLWGTIVEGEEGYRAERGRVIDLLGEKNKELLLAPYKNETSPPATDPVTTAIRKASLERANKRQMLDAQLASQTASYELKAIKHGDYLSLLITRGAHKKAVAIDMRQYRCISSIQGMSDLIGALYFKIINNTQVTPVDDEAGSSLFTLEHALTSVSSVMTAVVSGGYFPVADFTLSPYYLPDYPLQSMDDIILFNGLQLPKLHVPHGLGEQAYNTIMTALGKETVG
jgi:hypothetical protein